MKHKSFTPIWVAGIIVAFIFGVCLGTDRDRKAVQEARQEVQVLKTEIGVMSQIIEITSPVYEKSDLITDQDYVDWEEYNNLKALYEMYQLPYVCVIIAFINVMVALMVSSKNKQP